MRKIPFKEIFLYLNKILVKKQKKSALTLLLIMIVGMIFEVLLLNNLLILLNYLTQSETKTPEIVNYFANFFDIKQISILVLLLFISTFFIKTLATILVSWKESTFIFSLKAKISERLFLGYLNLPLIFHQRTNTAKILKNITFEVDQLSYLMKAISTLMLELLVLIGISSYLIAIDPLISSICIIAFLLFGYFFNLFNKGKIKSMSQKRLIHQDERVKSIMEGLTGMRELKLWSKENSFLKTFSFHNDEISHISTSTTLRNTLTKPSFEIFMLIILSVFLMYFISNNLLRASVIPLFGTYLAAAYRLVPSIARIVQAVQTMQFNVKCAKNLNDEIEKFNEARILKKNKTKKISFNKEIKIKNLTFSYELEKSNGKKTNVLENINFVINKGECIGIQGESGSGKSTLIDLLIGLQAPTKGEVLIDGENIIDSPEDWQKIIGCVPQEVFILDDTLRKNIAFGIPEKEISNDQINKCLEFSNLKNFLSTLEDQLDTIIGERGARISGGQRQRIGIARAMYNNPEVLIFDESTSSLDVETEEKIISEIYKFKRKKTVLIVSHKNKILKNCDYIFNIKEKKLEKINL